MEIRHLRYFVAVARYRHFGKAATSLHMAQPPLSQSVKYLENSIGYRLFERTSRRVTLTPGGEALLERASFLVENFDEFERFARQLNPVTQRELHIGFGGPSSISALPALARRLRDAQPNVSVHFHPVFGSPALVRLSEGQLDLAFTRCPLDTSAFGFHIFGFDRLVAVVSADNRFGGRSQITLDEVIRHRLVTFELSAVTNTRAICEEAARHKGIELDSVEAPDIQSMLGLVAADVGIGVVPESALALRVDGIKVVRLEHRYTHLASALAWRRADPSPLLQEVKDLIRVIFPEPARPEASVYGFDAAS